MSGTVEQRLTALENNLSTATNLIERQIRSADGRISTLEARMTSAEAKTQDLENKVSGLAAQLTDLENEVEQRTAALQGSFGQLASEVGTLSSGLQQVQTDVGNLKAEFASLNTSYAGHRHNLSIFTAMTDTESCVQNNYLLAFRVGTFGPGQPAPPYPLLTDPPS